IGKARPAQAAMYMRELDAKSACVDAVQVEKRQHRREAAGWRSAVLLEDLYDVERPDQVIARTARPVIEIAGDDEGRIVGHQPLDTPDQSIQLPLAPHAQQSQMHIDGMQLALPTRHCDLAVEQPAALERMHGYILVVPAHDGKFAQDCITVMGIV